MTTKPEMTLENVCFRYVKGEEYSEKCKSFIDEKHTNDIVASHWWIDGYFYSRYNGKIFTDKKKSDRLTEVSPSDYLLLLSAPESQAHLLTERSEPCGNCKETIKECACMRNICFKCNKPVGNITFSVCDECWNILHPPKNNSAKELLASQPPVMEGKEETTVEKFLHKEIGYDVSKSATLTLEIKSLALLMNDYANQKTSSLQDEIKSLRYDLFHVTASEQSLQSEVEQLKGALQELVDIQNGPPLEQHKKEWQEIIEKCYSILSK